MMSIAMLLILAVAVLAGGAILIGVVFLLFKGSDKLIDRMQNKRDQDADHRE